MAAAQDIVMEVDNYGLKVRLQFVSKKIMQHFAPVLAAKDEEITRLDEWLHHRDKCLDTAEVEIAALTQQLWFHEKALQQAMPADHLAASSKRILRFIATRLPFHAEADLEDVVALELTTIIEPYLTALKQQLAERDKRLAELGARNGNE